MKNALVDSQLPSTESVERMSRHLLARGRQLLGVGFSGAEFSDLTCGFKYDPDHPPNTYPCAKHLWCAVPPLIPRSFRFQKRWITWRESWVEKTKCPEMDTYGKWMVYTTRAIATSIREISRVTVRIWPWSEILDSFWSFAQFPDDQWPNVKRYGDEGAVYETLCILLNIGPLFVFLTAGILFLMISPALLVTAQVTGIVYDDVFKRYTKQDLEVERNKQERYRMTHSDNSTDDWLQ